MTEGKVTQWPLTPASSRHGEGGGKAGAFYASWYPRLAVGRGQAPRSYADYGELAGQMRFVERASRKLARSTFYGMARWQAGTEAHGAFLGRIVDIGAELFAMSAAVVYTQTQIREHPERAAETRELAEAFCNQAQHRTERLFHELWSNADDAQPPPGAGRPQAAGTRGWRRASSTRPPATARWSRRPTSTSGFRSPAPRRRQAPALESDSIPQQRFCEGS